jgi:hypothetical protein
MYPGIFSLGLGTGVAAVPSLDVGDSFGVVIYDS